MNHCHALRIRYWYANFIESDSIENFQSLSHVDEVGRIIKIKERASKLGRLIDVNQLLEVKRKVCI